MQARRTVIRGGQVYDHDGVVHRPALADIVVEGDTILAVGSRIEAFSADTLCRGRGVDSVMVNGRMVIRDRLVKSLDEDALRREVADLMRYFIPEYEAIVKSRKAALPHMLAAHRRVGERTSA